MRYLDLAVAAMIGASALSGILAWTPRTGDSASSSEILESHMRDQLLSYLRSRGTTWLLTATPDEICVDIGRLSNSSVRFGAIIGTVSCPSEPQVENVEANLTLHLLQREVVLEAWSAVPA